MDDLKEKVNAEIQKSRQLTISELHKFFFGQPESQE
jgi:hypothetical protein